jgi:hypothetical protein
MQRVDPGIYDENGTPIPDRDSSQVSRGAEVDNTGEWLFRELISPKKDQPSPAAYYPMRNGQVSYCLASLSPLVGPHTYPHQISLFVLLTQLAAPTGRDDKRRKEASPHHRPSRPL